MKICVIVPTRNREDLVVCTIASLLANVGPRFDIYLVDQSDDEATKRAVDPFQTDARFHYIRSGSVGSGAARNVALLTTDSDVALFTDDDCTVPHDWVATMAAVFTDQKVGMAFCNVRAGEHDIAAGFVPAYERKTDLVVRDVSQKNRARGIGAGMAVRVEAAQRLGGFDEQLPASMDGDLAVRMLLGGWYIHETSNTYVVHNGFRTWEQGKRLAHRNFTGIGQAYAKPIRLGKWGFLRVVLYEGFGLPAQEFSVALLHRRRPRGLRNILYFWRGFAAGLRLPLDRKYMIYQRDADAPHGSPLL